MIYRAVGNRCAVDFQSLQLDVPIETCLSILTKKVGFVSLEIDLISLAKSHVGKSEYRRAARISEAPHIFDCSSLIKWLYGQKGIWLPRRTIQQRELGIPVNPCDVQKEDVIFVSGFINYFLNDPSDGVGHVGIATGEGTVIHAANSKQGIIETPIEEFTKGAKLRGVRRYVPDNEKVHVFQTLPEREIETSDDIRWIIYQNLT